MLFFPTDEDQFLLAFYYATLNREVEVTVWNIYPLEEALVRDDCLASIVK